MLVVVLAKQRRCLLCIYVISRRRRRRRKRKECQYWRPPAGHVMPCVENKIKYNHHHSTISVPILLPLSYSSCITLVVVWHSLFLARGDLLDVHSRFLSSFIIIFMFCCFPRNFWPVSFFTHKYPFGMTFISVIMLSLRCRSSSSSSLWIKTSLCVQVLQFSSVGKKRNADLKSTVVVAARRMRERSSSIFGKNGIWQLSVSLQHFPNDSLSLS